MADLCEQHKLVLGPGGRCVLCRRPEPVAIEARDEQEEQLASKALTSLLGVCLLAALAILAYVWPHQGGQARYRPSGHPPPVALERQAIALPEGERAARQASAEAAGEAASPAVSPSRESAAGGASPNEPRAELSGSPRLQKAAPLHARGEVEVTMYAAPWCFICDRARDFLQSRGVTLAEHNVDADPRALKRLGRLSAAGALPTFEVAGETLVGFDPVRLEQRIDHVALSRYASGEQQ